MLTGLGGFHQTEDYLHEDQKTRWQGAENCLAGPLPDGHMSWVLPARRRERRSTVYQD
jgi:hypothetical protein